MSNVISKLNYFRVGMVVNAVTQAVMCAVMYACHVFITASHLANALVQVGATLLLLYLPGKRRQEFDEYADSPLGVVGTIVLLALGVVVYHQMSVLTGSLRLVGELVLAAFVLSLVGLVGIGVWRVRKHRTTTVEVGATAN